MKNLHFKNKDKAKLKEKMERSDKCPYPCRYKDLGSNKCAFETCLMEELPPTQKDPITVECWVCGSRFSTAVDSIFMDDRICTNCRLKIQELVINRTIPSLLTGTGNGGGGRGPTNDK